MVLFRALVLCTTAGGGGALRYETDGDTRRLA